MQVVSEQNIEAACAIHGTLKSWSAADAALERLNQHFPSNSSLVDVLAKASAIDKLYSTRAGNVYWLAHAVIASLQEVQTKQAKGKLLDCIDVVDLISWHKQHLYPDSDRCASFASKYCHFFVPGWEFPIYDSFALAAVNDVLGTRQYGLPSNRSEYRDFCERVTRLRNRDELQHVSARDLDRFLWLWGQWLAQEGYAEPKVNGEVYAAFRSDAPGRRWVEAMMPARQ